MSKIHLFLKIFLKCQYCVLRHQGEKNLTIGSYTRFVNLILNKKRSNLKEPNMNGSNGDYKGSQFFLSL